MHIGCGQSLLVLQEVDLGVGVGIGVGVGWILI
jgi:hypothetical protein